MRWLTWFRLRNVAKNAFAFGWVYVAVGIGLFRWRPNYVIERQIGERSLAGARRVAIFAHYDRQGRVHDYVIY